ncbi:MAG: adenosylmethionine--8-amino-7-oxononanoate transaminase [Gemmataceae bacterium]
MQDLEQLRRWDVDHLWHPFTQMQVYAASEPIIIERAEGFWLYDACGRRYLDGISSLWCNVHGHRVPELDQALVDQLDKVAHSTLLGLTHIPAIMLARRLVQVAPPGLTHVFFSDDGATSVEIALKMAFQYYRQRAHPQPQKTKYLAWAGAYHGDTLGDVSVGGVPRFHALFAPLLFPVYRAPSPYCYRCPLGLERSTCREACVEEALGLIEAHHRELAAVVIEPLIQCAAGMILFPPGALRRIREVTRRLDVLLIADEVATGFGRTGTLFACEQEQVTPDFLCLAKGLTGGYLPLAATLTTDEIYGAFLGRPEEQRTFYHGHTYTGNPLAASVALANLDLIERSGLLQALPHKVQILQKHLQRMATLKHVGEVRQCGLIAGIELVADKATRHPYPPEQQMGWQVCHAARARGVLLRPLGDVVVLFPAPAMPEHLLDWLCDVTYNAIEEVTEK